METWIQTKQTEMFLMQSKDCTEMMYGKQKGLRLEIYGPKLLYQKLNIISGQY